MSIGIIFISTRDPLSNLISLVYNTPYTTIGIYLEESLYLYDIWRANRPLWFDFYMRDRSYVDKEEILSCNLVSKIKLYPIEPNHINRFKVSLARTLSLDGELDPSENIFTLSYTGYDVINYIFLTMEGREKENVKGSLSLIDNAPLTRPIKHINNDESPKMYDKIFLVEAERMIDLFKKEYLSSGEFREKSKELRRDDLLYEYVILEEEIRKLAKDNMPCTSLLDRLNNIRETWSLPAVNMEDYSSSYKKELLSGIENMKTMLYDIIQKRESTEPIVIRFDNIINTFNDILKSMSIETLEEKDFYCNTAILTSNDSIEVEVNNKHITIYSGKLESYSKQELKEILKVVNELSGFDNKYIILQNSLIKELSRRI